MGNLGLKEILILVFVIVLLFGAKRIPELMRGMGKGIHEFKEGMKEGNEKDDTTGKKL